MQALLATSQAKFRRHYDFITAKVKAVLALIVCMSEAEACPEFNTCFELSMLYTTLTLIFLTQSPGNSTCSLKATKQAEPLKIAICLSRSAYFAFLSFHFTLQCSLSDLASE